MADEDKKWKRFENLAATIQRALAAGARVEQDVRIVGKASGVERQIDIAVWTTLANSSCSSRSIATRVDVKDVEAFIGLVKDVGASQGALVTAQGYTEAAKNVADAAGLRLFTLVDAESEDWPVFVSIPVLVDDRSIAGVSYGVSSTELKELDLTDLPATAVFRGDGTRIGPLRDLVSRLSNEEGIAHEQGEYTAVRLSTEPTFFRTDTGLARVELDANVPSARSAGAVLRLSPVGEGARLSRRPEGFPDHQVHHD